MKPSSAAGPGGLKPALELSYSSSASDGQGGERPKWQASWVGKGWSLEAGGAVALNRSLAGPQWDNFTFVFGGHSFDIIRGQLLSQLGCTDYNAHASWHCWTWHPVDESFVRVRAIETAPNSQQYWWQAWTKDGTRYDFTEPLWTHDTETRYIYKWLLTQVTDPHGNRIVYTYHIDTVFIGPNAYQPTYYLQTIAWGHDGATPGTGTPRYQVEFVAASRTLSPTTGVDGQWDYPGTDTFWKDITPHELYRLDAIKVKSWAPGASGYEIVRQYNLRYAPASQSLQTDDDIAQKVLTLVGVQLAGRYDPPQAPPVLPETTFTYYTDPNGPDGLNRLQTIDNGQGGRITFTYEHVWGPGQQPGNDCYCYYRNYYRVTRVLRESNIGQPYNQQTLTAYTYTAPDGTNSAALNDLAHAATVVYARHWSGFADDRIYLARREKYEFRGHARVREETYAGAVVDATKLLRRVEHWFYQGDAGCTPLVVEKLVETDSCYQEMVRRESWKGREYRTAIFAPDGALLQRTEHTFARHELPFFGSDSSVPNSATKSNNYKRVGLWRAFSFERQRVETVLDPGSSAMLQKTTRFFYNPLCQESGPVDSYGNLGCILEEHGAGALVRKTLRYHVVRDDGMSNGVWGPYLADRMWGETIFDGSGNLLAVTHRFYDGGSRPDTIGSRGLLTRESRFYDVPPSCCPNPIHSSDTTYGYDAYGNRTTVTTYAGPGTYTSATNTWSAPGGGSAARTTTTTYDATFHAFPIAVTNPLGHGEQAAYDFRMGTLTAVSDANDSPTNDTTVQARYDAFGRLVTLIKPGDSESLPTVEAVYDDRAYAARGQQPWRYEVRLREVAGTSAVRVLQQFYDGLGRLIQTRSESEDSGTPGADDVVVDKQYDGLDRLIWESQPRYVPAATTYSAPPNGLPATTTTYDALDRPLRVTQPDGSAIEHHYGVVVVNGEPLRYDDVIDPNRHRTQYRYDALERLREVVEIAGDCAQNYWQPTYACTGATTTPWTVYATTGYRYSPLDLLTQVIDAHGNVTSMTYDSLGRKTAMSDPDMGGWSYAYDANGNLVRQTDAKQQRICFYYDALDRLTGKHYRSDDACPATFPALSGDASYSYDQGVNGIGRRTGMQNASGSTSWTYDVRGRKIQETHRVVGLSGERTFQWAYDSADRVTQLTYPNTDVLRYIYDAGWRPASACPPSGPCYVSASQSATALDQPRQWTWSTGAMQTWEYSSPMQRLQQLRIGSSSNLGQFFHRTYTYDNGGNLTQITDQLAGQTQYFSYDHRDRLTRAAPTPPSGLAAPAFAATGAVARQFAPTGSARHPADLPALALPTALAAAPGPDAGLHPHAATPTDPDPTAVMDDPALPGAPAPAPAAPGPLPFARLPLAFIPNAGQVDQPQVRFQARSSGGLLFFTPAETVLALPAGPAEQLGGLPPLPPTAALSMTVVRLRYEGANPAPQVQPGAPLPGVANFLLGNDPAQWRTQVPTYAEIVYAGLYAGIDLHYAGSDGRLKSSYHVAPGADPGRIRWRYLGALEVRVDAATGDLHVTLAALGPGGVRRTLIEHAPSAWQVIAGQTVPVSVRFDVAANGSVGFALGSYDPTQPLIIDPILSYSTYHGGSGGDKANAVAVDSAGNVYVAGETASGSSFPLQNPAYTYRGNTDAFVSKLSADGQTLLWSTFIGGSNEDQAKGIALDNAGNVVLTGKTRSGGATPFPIKNGFDTSFGGGTCASEPCADAFVARLNPARSGSNQLLYSSYLGGSGEDEGLAVAVDTADRIYLTGLTAGGLTTKTAYDTSYNGGASDAFVSAINPAASGSASHLSTSYLGGSGDDAGNAIAVDSSGMVYVTGETKSSGFPTRNAYQASYGGSQDAFVAKLNVTVAGSGALLYSTFLGGSSYDKGSAIVVDSAGTVYLTGYARSSTFPTLNAWQPSLAGDKDAILVRLDPAQSGAASLLSSSYLGGTGEDEGTAIARDSAGLLYLTGFTQSDDFPTALALQGRRGSGTCGTADPHPCADAFVVQFDLARNTPRYSTYLGGAQADDAGRGIAADSSSAAYVAGITAGSFPTASPRQGSYGGGNYDAFVAKISLPRVALSAATTTVSEASATATLTVTLSATSPQTVTVAYATSDGTARSGSDDTALNGTLVVAPGQTRRTLSVPIGNDPTDEPHETFAVALANPSTALLGTPASTTSTITDDDAPPSLAWQRSSFRAAEGAGSGLVTVLLPAPSRYTVTVQYTTSDGTATAGSDYTATSGTLTVVPGATAKSSAVPISNDTASAGAETVQLSLSRPTNATLGAPATATLTIDDDDGTPPPTEEMSPYDALGNLTRKTGVGAYAYGANGNGTGAGPPQARTVGGQPSTYDANGTLLSGGGRLYTWDAEHRPTSSTSGGVAERSTSDADGERVARTVQGVTTVDLAGGGRRSSAAPSRCPSPSPARWWPCARAAS
jgi:YD repeat-containing protein